MAKNTPAFQYYPADLISDPDVMFWDMELLGCYWQMITYLWLNGGKFEFNVDKMRVLFSFKRNLRAVKSWNKIKEKFVLKDGYVSHKRVTEEIKKQSESRLKRKAAGVKGAGVRWKGDSNANGNAIPEPMPENGSSSSPPSSPIPSNKKTFEAFWETYPKRVGKEAAFKAWKTHKCNEITAIIIKSVKAHINSKPWKKDEGEFIPHPTTFLNQHRWEDEVEMPKITRQSTMKSGSAIVEKWKKDAEGGK